MTSADRLGIDTYVIDALMPDLVGHDRRPAALVVYLYLWRKTRGGARPAVISLSMFVDGTGLAKRSVQSALAHLEQRELLRATRGSATAAPSWQLCCHWRK